MRVYVYPADLAGCGYYRLIWPAKILQAAGHDVRLVHPRQTQKLTGGRDAGGRLVQVSVPKDADVMVFQRLTAKTMVDAVKILRANGVAVVVDVDDDMSAIHQHNAAWSVLHPASTGKNAEYDWNAARKICDGATLVTVSTDALLRRYAVHGRGEVLRNTVPEIFLQIPHQDSATIGWAAALHSHPDDPQVVGTALSRVVRGGARYRHVGAPHGVRSAFRLDEEPPSSGPVKIENWPHEVTKIGVGIAPLNDTRFNEAKSWLKMLEYAALGVPCVGSPRAEYRRLHEGYGVGVLAATPREWQRHLERLTRDVDYRLDLAQRGRLGVAELTIERNAWRWWRAWQRALETERGPLGLKPAVTTVPDQV